MTQAAGVFQTNLNNIGEFFDLLSLDSITAFSGGGQSSATQLLNQVNRITTVAAAADSVKLPVWSKGRNIVIINSGANALNLYGQTGDTINGQAANAALSIPGGGTVAEVFTVTQGAWFVQLSNQSGALPFSAVVSISSGNGTLTGAQCAGAANFELTTSGATALTTATAAQMLAAMAGAGVGTQWLLRIINTNGGTLTITADGTVTQTIGAMTIATNTWREFEMTITGAATATMKGRGTGTFS